MGVKSSTVLSTTRSVTKTVEDSTTEGYEVAYAGYFNASPNPFASRATTKTDSLDDPKDCV